nr:MAG TPA: hypothetical protein [Caudoviricetes sp.]DAV93468.1 MAG TPA: hypothetical protein [Caudoviricetes sp.]
MNFTVLAIVACRRHTWLRSYYPTSLFPLDSRKYMLVSIYYVDYGKIS